MKLAKLNLEQTIQRVSQMRKLGLSLREAYDQQYRLESWLKRVEELRALLTQRSQAEVTPSDLQALRAGFQDFCRKGDFVAILEIASKLPAELVTRDHLLAAYTALAHEQIENEK